MTRWRPALRMARRDLRRHPGRSALVLLLVLLPIAGATCAALVTHNGRWEGETAAHLRMGEADALVEVSPFTKVRVRRDPEGYMQLRPAEHATRHGKRVAVRRARSAVDLAALLPAGSRVIAAPVGDQVELTTGGTASVLLLDAADPMSRGLAAVVSGYTPRTRDEVAMPRAMADELGLLGKDGRLRTDATLTLAGGTRVRVVGLTGRSNDRAATLLAAPGSVLARHAPTEFLVDLPPLSGAETHALARSLAGAGVGMYPRDAFFHPIAWGIPQSPPSAVDAKAVAVGALVVLFGLVEVVLVVGSAFAVGARRQVRDLGLLGSSGGASSDVRRVLLAQGLVLGAGASVLGAAAGIGLFPLVLPLYERVWGQTVWTRDVPWAAVAGIVLLGSLTGLAAALVPAWSIGRLTPVDALSGRFPVRPGESRAHRPAFVLAGAGLVLLVLAGLWSAHEYAPQPGATPGYDGPDYHSPSTLPVALGGLGLLLLVAGTVWSAPYAVRVLAGLGRWLPLSGRFAFRDAARHRFRTAAAAVTLTVTVAGTVFAGFVMSSASADAAARSQLPPHAMTVYFDDSPQGATPATLARITATMTSVLGPVRTYASGWARPRGRQPGDFVGVQRQGDWVSPLSVVDESTLRFLAGDDLARALAAYRAGRVVVTDPSAVRHGTVRLAVENRRGQADRHWDLPATVLRGATSAQGGDLGTAWVSPAAVQALGLTVRPESALVVAGRTVTQDDVTRLAVHGIDVWTPDLEAAQLDRARSLLVAGAGLVTLLVVGIAVALAAAEGRADTATLAAVGAGPWRRRGLGAMHGLFLGVVGVLLGLAVGLPSSASLLQVDGLPGLAVPWNALLATLLVVPLLGATAGWLVTPSRLHLVRREG